MNMQTYRPFALAQPISLELLRLFLLLCRLAAAGGSVVVAPSGGPVVAPAQARRRGRPGRFVPISFIIGLVADLLGC
jgi:hypothetical protein